jgi:hypothetical protein
MHTAAVMLFTKGVSVNDACCAHIPHHTASQSHTLSGARDDIVIKACTKGTLRGSVTCKQFVTYTPITGQFVRRLLGKRLYLRNWASPLGNY